MCKLFIIINRLGSNLMGLIKSNELLMISFRFGRKKSQSDYSENKLEQITHGMAIFYLVQSMYT